MPVEPSGSPGTLQLSPDVARVEAGQGGLPRLVINSPFSTAHVYLHGAHVTHFQQHGGEPMLSMSGKSYFAPGKPIRGGIPLIFPWFGPRTDDSTAPAHGFARTVDWKLIDAAASSDAVTVRLELVSGDATRKWLPNDFRLIYSIRIGSTLDLSLEVQNLSQSALRFEEALHTYLKVKDVRQVSIDGLSGKTFIDKTDAGERKVQSGPIRITAETDRVYLDTTQAVSATDPGMNRRLVVSKTGSQSTVIWNPWIDKAKAMSDFGDDEWPGMLCIETANAADNAISLASEQSHVMSATIAVQPL